MADSKNHALVIGASGVIGWSVVNQLLQPYPSPSPFTNITALVNRPIDLKDSFWPEHASGRPELSLVTGVDLLCSDADFEVIVRERVPNVESISHVYYFGEKSSSRWISKLFI
jgi:nucleoside-diphosphate-sugar epimerase